MHEVFIKLQVQIILTNYILFEMLQGTNYFILFRKGSSQSSNQARNPDIVRQNMVSDPIEHISKIIEKQQRRDVCYIQVC